MSEPQSVPPSGLAAPQEPPVKTSRRKVLKVAAVAAAGVAVGVGTPAALNRVLFGGGQPPRWRFLTDAEASLLDAVCRQIIPTDQDPGAREAGCVVYIDRQLVGPHQRFADRYRAGLASLAATCQALHGKPFEELSSAEQIKLLEKLETGQAPKEHWKIVSVLENSSSWFAITPCRASTAARATAATRITPATACSAWIIPTSSGRTVTAAVLEPLHPGAPMALPHVNAVIVGAGAGGGIVAKELAEAGLSVVLLERGQWPQL